MEKDEKLIRELLEKGMLKKAPDNFTDKVMMAVATSETQHKPVFDLSFLSYALIVIGALVVSIGVLYFTSKELLIKYYSYFFDFLSATTAFTASLFSNFNTSFSSLPGSGLIAGVVLIMTALLLFDRFLFTGRRYVNVFIW